MPCTDIAFYGVGPVRERSDKNPFGIICRIGFLTQIIKDCIRAIELVVFDKAVQEITSRIRNDNIPAQIPNLSLK